MPERTLRRAGGAALRGARRALDVSLIERARGVPREAAGTIWLDQLGYAGEHRKSYAPSPWRVLERMLPVDEVDLADVFLDFGCGIGRIVLQAAERYPFETVLGVELVPQLADSARALLTRNQHRLRCRQWQIATADALDYPIPDDVTVAYFYDPFTGPVFDAVLSRLETSLERNPRRLRFLYLTPTEASRIVRSGRVTPVRRGTTGLLHPGGRMEYFVGDMPARRGDPLIRHADLEAGLGEQTPSSTNSP